MQDFVELLANLDENTYQQFKTALELSKWPDGRRLTQEQKETVMMAIIAWEQQNLPEDQRTGYMGGQECGSKNKKSTIDDSLFAPAKGTLH